jgi:phosphohistidine swiveling domain-containing protein
MKKIKIDPEKKLFYWGPIDGHPIFPDFWNLGMYLFSQKFKPGWPETIINFSKGKMTFVCDFEELYGNGEEIFIKYILNEERFASVYQRWETSLKRLDIILATIIKENLSNLSKKELSSLFLKFSLIYSEDFWYYGLMPEIANWGGEQLLTREVRKKIKKESDYVYALERLSAPENFSFFQNEELNLLKIKLEKDKIEKQKRIIEHQKEYFWILNNYHHSKVLSVSYFEKELAKFSISEAKKKIEEINKLKSDAIKKKQQTVKKFKLPRNIIQISRQLAFCIWWQDLRKAYILQANHIIDSFIKEFSKRYNINIDDLYFYTAKELKILVQKKAQNKDEIERRKKHFLVYYTSSKDTTLFSGKKAREEFQPYLKKNIEEDIKVFGGLVVNRGIIRGEVRILSSSEESKKMKKGDILVATMTTPDFIVALKKAGAIITDEGGMTCHAAIVARELNIPAIVGTKIATQVLKNGDIVEVDANRGIVKIIKKAK